MWRPPTNDNRSGPSEDDWRLDDWFPYANELRLLSSKKTLSPGDINARVHGYVSYTDGGVACEPCQYQFCHALTHIAGELYLQGFIGTIGEMRS